MEAVKNPKYSYGMSKLSQILWTQELSNIMKINSKDVFVNACNPGNVDTPIILKGIQKQKASTFSLLQY